MSPGVPFLSIERNAVYETPFTTNCPSDGSKKPHITGSNKNVQIWRAKIVFLLIRNSTPIDHSIIPLTEYGVNSTKARQTQAMSIQITNNKKGHN